MLERLRRFGGFGWAVMGLVTAVRCVAWWHAPLGHDECSGLYRASLIQSGWKEFWELGVLTDAHPPGVAFLLVAWTSFGNGLGVDHAGQAELWVKAPFLLLSIIGLLALAEMARKWAGKHSAWLTIGVFGFLQWPLHQAVTARPYAAGLTAVFLAGSLLSEPERTGWRWRLGLAMAAAAYCHHFALLQVVLLWLASWWAAPPRRRRDLMQAALMAAALYAPLLPTLLHQFGHGGLPQFLSEPDVDFIPHHLNLLFNDALSLQALLLAGILAAAVGVRNGATWRRVGLGAGLFITPLALAFVYSAVRSPILMDRTLFFASPFLIMAACMAAMEGWKRWLRVDPRILVVVATAITASALFFQRKHHVVAWRSSFRGIHAAALDNPDGLNFLNAPDRFWPILDLPPLDSLSNVEPAKMASVLSASADSTLPSLGLGRGPHSVNLDANADAMLWFLRSPVSRVNFYNGEFVRYGPLRAPSDTIPALTIPGRERDTVLWGPSASCSLNEVLDATCPSLEPSPSLEIYAGLKVHADPESQCRLGMTLRLDGEPITHKTMSPAPESGPWLAVGIKLILWNFTPDELDRLDLVVNLYNPQREDISTGDLMISAIQGNPIHYALHSPLRDVRHNADLLGSTKAPFLN